MGGFLLPYLLGSTRALSSWGSARAWLSLLGLLIARPVEADNWARWRGPQGSAVSAETGIPLQWDQDRNIRWKTAIPGEGSSSPIVWNDRVFLTSAEDEGCRRWLHCLDLPSGRIIWSAQVEHDWPELTSALTGHAAATPTTDGQRVFTWFGNAGLSCHDFAGRQVWRRDLGVFESELGLASSPVLVGERLILVCDHDGTRFKSFDSFLIALDPQTGQTLWKTPRAGLLRSWSTPIAVESAQEKILIVNAQDQLRAYDLIHGRQQWSVAGMTPWVTPSPVVSGGLIFASSGRDGPALAVKPGGRGDVTETHVAWKQSRGAPYVCSPIVYQGYLYLLNESGIITCLKARSGALQYRQRLGGKFYASPVAAENRLYLTDELGVTWVIGAGASFRLLAKNRLASGCLASPAISAGCLLLRSRDHLFCVSIQPERE
ncbi:MAG: PQQ-binding-like beta-propeller repeat protein [Pirellulales bacterium]|nr:PQQ-binding-like beta-propeller repeat protein [Pirellulales bacterium]